MLDKPEQTAAEEEVSVVQEDTISAETIAAEPANVATKKSSKKKATVKRKAPTAKSKRRKPAEKPVAPAPPPLTLEELKEQGREAKQEVINAVVEPALIAVGSLSQTIRDTIGGTLAGILSRKRRD